MALEINGQFIEDAVIRREAQLLRPSCAEMLAECDPLSGEMKLRAMARRHVIERVLLQQEADKGGQEASAEARLELLIGKIFSKVAKPKPKELMDYYRKYPEQFQALEHLRATHIIKNVDESHPEASARETIEKVRGLLETGVAFAELADRFSDCPGNGGDLGYFPRGQMVEEFDEVVFALKVGEVSPVFRTSFGFHIAKVLDRKPSGLQPFQEVRTVLEDGLHRIKQRKALDAFIDTLATRAEIREVRSVAKT